MAGSGIEKVQTAGLILLIAGMTLCFVRLSIKNEGELRLGAVVAGLMFSVLAVAISIPLTRWLFTKRSKLDDIKFAGQAAGMVVLYLVFQAVFMLLIGFAIYVIARILGFQSVGHEQ